jgi:hypothetical protein
VIWRADTGADNYFEAVPLKVIEQKKCAPKYRVECLADSTTDTVNLSEIRVPLQHDSGSDRDGKPLGKRDGY